MGRATIKRLLILLLWGILTAAVIYPLLHEAGHIAAGVAMRAQGVRAGFEGGLYISLRLSDASPLKRLVTGLGGMLMPPAAAAFLPRKHFGLWYTRLILFMCCELSFAVSLISAGFGINPQDDYYSSTIPNSVGTAVYTAVCAAFFIILFICIKIQKPIDRILSDYVLKQNKNGCEIL